jgi:beta-galactosidase
VLSKGHPLPGELKTLLANGGRCLVMAQQPEWHESALGLRVAKHLSRRVFPVDSRHPVTCRAGRAGPARLGRPEYSGRVTPDYGTENHLPPYGWRWGNRGALTSGAIEKPHLSGWRPILEAEFDLAYTPLMELDYGRAASSGAPWTWRITSRQTRRRCCWRSGLSSTRRKRRCRLAPRPWFTLVTQAGASQLEAIGVAFNKSTQLPAPDGLAIIGAGASVDDAALQRFVEQGGRVLVLTQEGEQGRLGVTLKKTAEAGRGHARPPGRKRGGFRSPTCTAALRSRAGSLTAAPKADSADSSVAR